jgi:hypothetical protein
MSIQLQTYTERCKACGPRTERILHPLPGHLLLLGLCLIHRGHQETYVTLVNDPRRLQGSNAIESRHQHKTIAEKILC